MAKNAAKKRRSGIRRVSKQAKNTFRYKKPEISSEVVRELWDNNLTAETNMAKLGLRQSANREIRPVASRAAAKSAPAARVVEACEVSRLFGVADTEDLKVVDRNYGRRPMSDEDQRYTARLMAKHGLDHEAMARDIKANYNQLTLGQLRRMCNTLLALGEDQRVAALPNKVKDAAMAFPAANSARKTAVIASGQTAANEVETAGYGDGGVVARDGTASKRMESKGNGKGKMNSSK